MGFSYCSGFHESTLVFLLSKQAVVVNFVRCSRGLFGPFELSPVEGPGDGRMEGLEFMSDHTHLP